MKAAGIILIVLLLAAVAGLGLLYLTSGFDVTYSECIVTDAVTQADYFAQIKKQVANDTFIGTRFSKAEISSADQYVFYTYTLRLRNKAHLKAEVIEIRVTPMDGDVLQIGETTPYDLNADRSMDLSVTILTDRSMHSVREATVTWYIWGIPFSEKVMLGGQGSR